MYGPITTLMGMLFLSPTLLADTPTDQSAVAPDGQIELFDGDLDAFYSWLKDTQYEDPREVFRVTDGVLHVTGDGLGALVTNDRFRDYHCVLEFRWGERVWQTRTDRTRDSGLLIHSRKPDGAYNGTWMHSIEVQIIQGGCGDFILVNGNDEDGRPLPMSLTCEVGRDRDGEVIWQRGGPREMFNVENRRRINWFGRDPDWADVLDFRGEHDIESPGRQWTRFDVICDGDHVQTYVNGVLVNEAFDVEPASGRLQLQTELAELFVRRWELWPVGEGPDPAPADQ